MLAQKNQNMAFKTSKMDQIALEYSTVHSPPFSRKIVEIERFALRAVILHECQSYLGGGGG